MDQLKTRIIIFHPNLLLLNSRVFMDNSNTGMHIFSLELPNCNKQFLLL